LKIQSKYNEEKYDDHKENEFPNKENNIEKIFNKSSYHRNIVSDNNLKKRLSTSSSVYEDDFEDYEGDFLGKCIFMHDYICILLHVVCIYTFKCICIISTNNYYYNYPFS
jgi:hypothetical protein